eukprot:3862968-Pyramimonas_sp.AAC.1
MSCIAVLFLDISTAHSDDDLTHWEWAIPTSPVVLRGCGAMIIDQVSFIVVMLTGDRSFTA